MDTARPGLALVLVDPGYQPSDEPAAFRQSGTTGSGTASGTTTTAAIDLHRPHRDHRGGRPRVPMPNIRRRAEWGANPTGGDRPGLLEDDPPGARAPPPGPTATAARTCRGSSAACTGTPHQVLGWSDIGYNFLVDKFGKIWAGRAGGVMQPVRGAHTLGFNRNTVGVAAIGDYEKAVAGW